MKKIVFFLLIVCTSVHLMFSQSMYSEFAGKITYVVAKDGSGDYTTVTAAIAATPDNSATRTVIFIKNGWYYEKIDIAATKKNLTLVGENVDSTVIYYNDYTGKVVGTTTIGTSTSHTLIVRAEYFYAMNLTIANTSGDVGQAVALNVKGDKQTLVHCRLVGFQDTFYTWGEGRFYLKDCYIEGATDFIFGRGALVLDSCLIHGLKQNSFLTAASTDTGYKYGYVFRNCKLTAPGSITSMYLGRPWKAYAKTVYMNCDLGSFINPAGWSIWSGTTNNETCFYAEYNNFGLGSDTASRVDWAYFLPDSVASKYVLDTLFSRYVKPTPWTAEWNPNVETDSLCQIVFANTTPFIKSMDANLASLKYSGTSVTNFNPNNHTYVVVLDSSITVAPTIEALAVDTSAIVTIEDAVSIPDAAKITVMLSDSSATLVYYVLFTYEAPSGVKDITSNEYVRIVNPVKHGVINISISQTIAEDLCFSAYDMSGKLVLSKQKRNVQGNWDINAGSLSQGVYIYTLQHGTVFTHGKILVE